MLSEYLLYARGLADWPMDILKDVKANKFKGSGGKRRNNRKKKPNMNHVSRSTRRKHKRTR